MRLTTYADVRAIAEEMQQFLSDARTAVGDRTVAEVEQDRMIQYVLTRTLELLGESSKKIPKSIVAEFPSIPWSGILGLRNILAHDYGKVDYAVLHRLVTRDADEFAREIDRMILWLSDRGEELLPPKLPDA